VIIIWIKKEFNHQSSIINNNNIITDEAAGSAKGQVVD
jgi:hypothetical protein